jgi:hypothetical protein
MPTIVNRKLFGLENLKAYFDNFVHFSQIYFFSIFRYLIVTHFKPLGSHHGQIYNLVLNSSSANFESIWLDFDHNYTTS